MPDREPVEHSATEAAPKQPEATDPIIEIAGEVTDDDPVYEEEEDAEGWRASAESPGGAGSPPIPAYTPLLATPARVRRNEGRASFLYDYDPSGERVPSKPRFALAGVALLAAIVFGFWVVKAAEQETKAPDAPKQAKSNDDRQVPIVRGQNLPRREPRYSAAPLEQDEPPDDAPVVPPPEPVTAPTVEPAPAPPRAPDSWRTSLSVRVPEEEELDDDEATEPSGLGVTIVEGTEIEAVLEGKIDAPDAGLEPELNRVKAVLVADYSLDGRVVFPAGTEFLGRVQQTADKKIHVVFHRVILPDRTTAPCKAIALDSDLAAGIRADRIEKYRKQNVFGRVGRGVVDAAASVASFGRSGVGAIGAGAAAGAAAQGREETDGVRRPKRLLHVAAGRPIFIQLSADLSL